MKILIVYDTYAGTTEKCAQILSQKIKGEEIQLVKIRKNDEVDLENYNVVLISSYVYAGKVSGKISKFCKKNLENLLDKKVGIFLCMLDDSKNLEKYLRSNFDDKLLRRAIVKGCFGSELNYERMNPIVRFIIKQIVKKAQPEVGLRLNEIEKFVERLNS
ncbi:flavodoxin domain-containing protein [Pseudothermotoga thermarum]|uniref:Flavodoxin-like protein n=1 Tax=Pseudothermotoga thermarum DSM 5069 TaxID=688269 RepID=F7YW54_9THEM|nr:flavodoxin domain-containing protein [Pseudothermotoga thermarum]AEH50543.1 flavodoxin-like protein [Pseudothermotoga thermarum DSM 5069]